MRRIIGVSLLLISSSLTALQQKIPKTSDAAGDDNLTIFIHPEPAVLKKAQYAVSLVKNDPQSIDVVLDLRKISPAISILNVTFTVQAVTSNGKVLNQKVIAFTDSEVPVLYGGAVFKRTFKLETPLAAGKFTVKGTDFKGTMRSEIQVHREDIPSDRRPTV